MIGGIEYSTKTNNRYSNGGRVKFEITAKISTKEFLFADKE